MIHYGHRDKGERGKVMQKFEILIEENAFGSVRPVEVAATTLISALVPALVKELKLPQTDLFGKQLVYILREAIGGRILPGDSTLLAAGIKPGMRVALDSYVLDGSVAAMEGIAQPWQFQEPVQQGARRQGSSVHYISTPTGEYRRDDPGGNPASDPLGGVGQDADFHSSTTLADDNSMPVTGPRSTSAVLAAVKKRSWTRRAFLITGGAVLVAGSAGLGYAAYHTLMKGSMTAFNSPAVHPPSPAPRIPAQPIIPTMAKLMLTFTVHQQIVRSISWSPDGTMLVSGADDTQVLVWNMKGIVQQHIPHRAPVHALAWSPDGQQLVTGAANQVAFFNPLTGAVLARSTNQHVGMVTSLAWALHNQMQVVSGAADMRAIVWSPTNHQPETIFTRHTTPIDAVTWAADGQTVASSSQGGVVRIWNAVSGQELHAPYIDAQIPMRAIAFAFSGAQLAVGGDDGVVRLWNGLTCQQQVMGTRCLDVPMRLRASKQAIRTVAWSPDARFLAVGGNDGMFSLWYPMQSQKPLLSVKQTAAVHSIAWIPDGTQIAVATGNTVTLWKLM
jgi:WD40 repeat protein